MPSSANVVLGGAVDSGVVTGGIWLVSVGDYVQEAHAMVSELLRRMHRDT